MKRIQMTGKIPVMFACIVFGYSLTTGGQNLSNRDDEAAIRKAIAATTDAFNRHDAKAFAGFYTPDAELVTVRGERMTGATEIESGLAAIFATRAKFATLKTLDVRIRFIKPDVAVAHVTNEMSGVMNAQGEEQPSHAELSIRVFVKNDGEWRVTAFHNTIVSLPAARGPASAEISRRAGRITDMTSYSTRAEAGWISSSS